MDGRDTLKFEETDELVRAAVALVHPQDQPSGHFHIRFVRASTDSGASMS